MLRYSNGGRGQGIAMTALEEGWAKIDGDWGRVAGGDESGIMIESSSSSPRRIFQEMYVLFGYYHQYIESRVYPFANGRAQFLIASSELVVDLQTLASRSYLRPRMTLFFFRIFPSREVSEGHGKYRIPSNLFINIAFFIRHHKNSRKNENFHINIGQLHHKLDITFTSPIWPGRPFSIIIIINLSHEVSITIYKSPQHQLAKTTNRQNPLANQPDKSSPIPLHLIPRHKHKHPFSRIISPPLHSTLPTNTAPSPESAIEHYAHFGDSSLEGLYGKEEEVGLEGFDGVEDGIAG
ncbi:uncharacterized protein MYCFIDRAFT_173041 [Pseudocercospora fijiensis CIRAD86]|uniref:Uncharacterized protein n=1 Tax=Pseudocercospora fijiensis (strain CIRAD86) TaxID=383855 RepID=M3B3L1_PSEFD|nr:uncharacterized protein MYCFIDRAFT_173041 [Pseudocercospora fijiensis CIRAD86]EME83973.1 hypothetical protein MYCFIDRAFT_173041 [Pseudocercospora fijiensis CIRAD86]